MHRNRILSILLLARPLLTICRQNSETLPIGRDIGLGAGHEMSVTVKFGSGAWLYALLKKEKIKIIREDAKSFVNFFMFLGLRIIG